jgi:hypothetical protein
MRWSMTALVSLAFVASGCGGTADESSACSPGESESCECTSEGTPSPGERLCREGGAEWTECHCSGVSGDASSSDAGPTPSPDVSGPGPRGSDVPASPQDVTPRAPDTNGPTDPDTTGPDTTDPDEPDATDPDATDATDADEPEDTEEPDTMACVPDCADKACGGDGCGGTCGTCEAGWTCEAGACQALPPCTSDDDCAAFSAAQVCWTFICDPVDGCVADTFHEGDPCDDGDPCTFGALCVINESDEELCLGTPVPVDDGNDCTEDACVDGVIIHNDAPDESPCDYGPNDCTSGDSCVEGECVVGAPLELDDGNDCTDDACVEGEVVHTALLKGECDDGDECTTNDSCVEGTCTGGGVVECAAGPCATDAVCVSGEGCVDSLAPADTPCDADDNVCTLDTCDAAGSCEATGEVDSCQVESAEGPCWTWVCNPDTGCMTAGFTAGGECNDNDPCTYGDSCTVDAAAQAVCAGLPLPVDDGNACTEDVCVGGAVIHNPITGAFCVVAGCGGLGICVGGMCLEPDGCGCGDGTCGAGEDCANCEADCGLCECAPACAGKDCGPDGCGGSCGTCAVGAPCSASGLCPN